MIDLDDVYSFVGKYYILILIVLFYLAKVYGSRRNKVLLEQAMKGSLVETINSISDWDKKATSSKKKIIVVDFFATWCGPCVSAAPVFANLSKEYKEKDVAFWKVDVDQCAQIASREGVSAMPTFKIFANENGKLREIEKIVGFNQSKIESLISSLAK